METQVENKFYTLKNVLLVMGSVAIIGLGYTVYTQSKEKAALQSEIQTLSGYNKEAISGFAKIERNLLDIHQREGTIVSDLNEEGIGENSQQRIEKEIKAIENLIAENKALINSLKLNVGEKDQQIGEFATSIKQLETRIKGYREEADYLRTTLKYANKKGDSLSQQLVQRDFDLSVKTQLVDLQAEHLTGMTTQIRKMDYEQREAYFVVGTYDELKEENVVAKQGGVLGMGKTKVVKENFDREKFVKIDKLDFETIPVFAKSAEVISNHDSDSYEYEYAADGSVEFIKILDPEKFWENTRYLVVVTKGSTIQI